MSATTDKLNALVTQFGEDEGKFNEKGNGSAATRARKTLQEIRVVAKQARDEIQLKRQSEKESE